MVGRRPLEANIPGSSPGSATNETFLYGKFLGIYGQKSLTQHPTHCNLHLSF